MVVKAQMEFHEKLQQLRKQKGLTQEELAEQLHVSRTAVSKWESGRGFPNIESLKAIAKFFGVSLDELLSGEEILNIAESDHKEKRKMIRDLVFGLLDCGMALLLFLPFFGEEAGGVIRGISLLSITGLQPYMKMVYFAAV
jgi:transcriptional regulator with XRE-family HTH domain